MMHLRPAASPCWVHAPGARPAGAGAQQLIGPGTRRPGRPGAASRKGEGAQGWAGAASLSVHHTTRCDGEAWLCRPQPVWPPRGRPPFGTCAPIGTALHAYLVDDLVAGQGRAAGDPAEDAFFAALCRGRASAEGPPGAHNGGSGARRLGMRSSRCHHVQCGPGRSPQRFCAACRSPSGPRSSRRGSGCLTF